MTWEELNEVRTLKEEIKKAEKTLAVWKRAASLGVPKYDGLPKSKPVSSRVEKVAIKIVDATNRIEDLKNELDAAAIQLERKIFDEVPNSTLRTLLTLRYVECMYFRDIGFVMGYSEQHIYYLHNKAMKMLEN